MSSINAIGAGAPIMPQSALPSASGDAMGGGAPVKQPTQKAPCPIHGNATQTGGGGSVGAAAGADQVTGGGDPAVGSLAAAVSALADAVKKLGEVIAKMQGGAQVAGVQGTAATENQFVHNVGRAIASGGQEDDAYEQRVLELINEVRAKNGLKPVLYNPLLDASAEKHASHMAKVGIMAHEGIGDGSPGDRIRMEGFKDAWGENVATGQMSPEQVVQEWMNSPSHARNILDPNFQQMGVGYVTDANGRSYWAQSFGA